MKGNKKARRKILKSLSWISRDFGVVSRKPKTKKLLKRFLRRGIRRDLEKDLYQEIKEV